jgi:hypothetical protein
MKVLAIIDVAEGAAMERFRTELVQELKGSWALFAGACCGKPMPHRRPPAWCSCWKPRTRLMLGRHSNNCR